MRNEKINKLGRKSIFPLFYLLIPLLFASCGFSLDIEAMRPKLTETVTYTVSFNADCGTPLPENQIVTSGGKAEEPDVITKAGFTFEGWYKESSFTAKWDFDEDIVTDNIELFAMWNISVSDKFIVTFESNGGSYVPGQEVEEGGKVLRPPDPTRSDRLFGNWYSNSELTSAYNFSTSVFSSFTLYASWVNPGTSKFTVTFYSSPGSSVDPQSIFEGERVVRPIDPVRPGWALENWYIDTNFNVPFQFTNPITRNTDIYARWIPAVVTFDNNGGDTEANPRIMTANTTTATVDALPQEPTREGWSFHGWNTQADGSGAGFTAASIVMGNVTVYAQWKPIYTITFDKNNTDVGSTEASPQIKTVVYPATTVGTLPQEPTRAGWTFAGWNTAADGLGVGFTEITTVNITMTVYAVWTRTVTYNKNNTDTGSTEASPQIKTVVYPATTVGALPQSPVRPTWVFAGWNTQADGSGSAFTAATTVTGNITVYAVWTRTVTFNKNNTDTGSTEASPQSIMVIAPAATVDTLPQQPALPGWTFAGWNTHADNSGAVFTATSTVTGNMTVYAVWTRTVTYNKNNTDTGSTEASPQIKTVVYPATTVGALPQTPVRSTWAFAGWNTKADGSGSAFTAATTVPGNITVYAVWTRAVTFNKNNTDTGSTEASPQSMTVISPATTVGTLPQPPVRKTWAFTGWNTKADGSGNSFTEATVVTGNTTMYAQWSIEMVWIPSGTFQMDGSDSGGTSRPVTISNGFYMGKYEVTQEQWTVVMGSLPSSLASSSTIGKGDKYPVYYTSRFDAIVFCNRLSIMEGLTPAYQISGSTNPNDWETVQTAAIDIVSGSTGYRLPTEAQWEYACRAGTTTAFNWGSNIINSTQANYDAYYVDSYNTEAGTRLGRTTDEVGGYAPNAWGLYDMHGNVREWCWDWYGSYATGAQTDPTGAVDFFYYCVLRGGGWNSSGQYLRSAHRGFSDPSFRSHDIGFRLVRP